MRHQCAAPNHAPSGPENAPGLIGNRGPSAISSPPSQRRRCRRALAMRSPAAACELIRKVEILAGMQGSALAAVRTCRRHSHGLSDRHPKLATARPPNCHLSNVSRRVKFVPIPSDSQCRTALDQPRAIGEYLSFIFSAPATACRWGLLNAVRSCVLREK